MEETQKKLEEAEQRVQSLEEEKDKKREKKKKKPDSQVGVKHTKLLQQACFIYFIKEKEIKTQIKIELQISSPKTPQRKPWLHLTKPETQINPWVHLISKKNP